MVSLSSKKDNLSSRYVIFFIWDKIKEGSYKKERRAYIKMGRKRKKKSQYNMWQNTKYMLQMVHRCRHYSVIVVCILLAVFQVCSRLTELFLSPVILSCVERSVSLKELVGTILFFSILMFVWSGLTAYLKTAKQSGRISVRSKMIVDLIYKACSTSYPNLEDQDIIKMKQNAHDAVSGNHKGTEAVWDTYTMIIQNIAGFVIYLFLLTATDPIIIGITIITTILGYMANLYVRDWRYNHKEEEAEYLNRSYYVLRKAEEVKIAKDLRIFGMGEWLEDIYNNAIRLCRRFFAKVEKRKLAADIWSVLLAFLRNGIAYIYLLSITLKQQLPASQFLLYFAVVGGFTSWINGILSSFGKLYEQSIDISKVREFMDIKEPFIFEKGEKVTPASFSEYCLELKDVSFRYPGAEKDTLHHINLLIQPGEKLAVVGLNGAGKTTLVKLLCGYYDPTEGQVLLNGRDIRQFNRKDYYTLFSAVFQEFSVLEVQLSENITQSYQNMDMELVKECVEKAGLKEKIESLPQKYQTHLGKKIFEDGIELSGGEMQRLMLARALYKNAPILVLDEPTAALDPLAEHDIYQKYHTMMKGRTSIYISHRLASTRFCDRIIYLKNGRIEESGTHKELLDFGGEYAEMFQVQSKYYKEENYGTEG